MSNKLTNYSNNKIIEILNTSKSFREALSVFGYSSDGSGAYSLVKKILKERNINIPKYNYYGDGKSNPKFSLDEILVKNSPYKSRTSLKKRLIRENLLEYKCKKCGNLGIWNNEPLILQLEHKNGINNDNRLENLEFLCPNCHSQSKTFAGRNNKKNNKCSCGKIKDKNSVKCAKCNSKSQRKVKRPSYKQLLKEINELGYSGTGRKYGVSDNSIRKWKKYYEKNIEG